jgi:hypothetical protein
MLTMTTPRHYRKQTEKTKKTSIFSCVACGRSFGSLRPQDPELPSGKGRCFSCRTEQVLEIVQMGLRGRYLSKEQAEAHISKYA